MRDFLIKYYMAAKKKVTKEKTVEEQVIEVAKAVIPVTKGPNHIVKDGEIILDPKFTNPGVFSQ